MKTTPHGQSTCLNCGKSLDASSNLHDSVPEPGDVTICLYCGHLMEYGIGLVLLPPSDETILDVAGDKELVRVMEIIKLARDLEKQFKKPLSD